MAVRTDLAVEWLEAAEAESLAETEYSEETIDGHRVFAVTVGENSPIGKPKGKYITFEAADFRSSGYDFPDEVATVAKLIKALIYNEGKNPRSFLVVGLGNRSITPDAIGPIAADLIFVTSHIGEPLRRSLGFSDLTDVSAIAAGVLGQTGMESSEVIKAIAAAKKPDCIIVIDALAAKSLDRLAATIQLSTAGISPGSGVQNARGELSFNTLGIPVIAIGVPMVVDMETAAQAVFGLSETAVSEKGRDMFVTPREVDLAVEHAAKTIAYSVNLALNPSLSFEEMTALVG